MKASKLIQILQDLVEKDGDLDISIDVYSQFSRSPYYADLQHSDSWNYTYTVYAGGKTASINCWLRSDSKGREASVSFR